MDWILDFYNYRVVAQYLPEFARGLGSTAWISLLALGISLSVGTIVAIMRMSTNPLIWRIAAGYVQAIRSTPLLIQIYLIYFTLPAFPCSTVAWTNSRGASSRLVSMLVLT